MYKTVIFPMYECNHTIQQLQILQNLLQSKKLNFFSLQARSFYLSTVPFKFSPLQASNFTVQQD